jgi:VWFA-related protein
VTVVPLDIRVVDRQGKPVNDLTKDDFVVLEDGVRQEITHFDPHALTTGTPGPLPARSTGAPLGLEIRNRRIFYIELGRQWLGNVPFGLVEALTTFLRERLLPQDYAAVSIFGRITDLTTDHDALAQVIERVAAFHTAMERSNERRQLMRAMWMWRNQPPDSPIRRGFDEAFAPASSGWRLSLRPATEYAKLLDSIVAHSQTGGSALPSNKSPNFGIYSEMLTLLGAVEYLRFLEGEKHLIYFPGILPKWVDDDRAISRVANDARVALHLIARTEGLPTRSLNLAADMSAKNIAEWTGGSVFINRWPDEALAKIDEVTRGGYLLAYSPIKASDERYRKITVRVKRPDGATVMVRESYLPTEHPPTYDPVTDTAKQHMLTVAEFPGGVDDLGVAVTAKAASPASLNAQVAVDVARVHFTQDGDRHVAKLEVAIFCTDARERLVGQRWITLDLKLAEATWARALAEGLKQPVTVPVTGRVRYVKAVVYDYGTSRAGAAVADVK